MSKLYIHGNIASGTSDTATNIKVDSIDGLSANNVQEGLSALNDKIDNKSDDTITVLNSQSEYDALTDEEKASGSYLIKNTNVGNIPTAVQIKYDNITNVKSKIDSLAAGLEETNTSLTTLVVSEQVNKTVTFNDISGDTSRHRAEGSFTVPTKEGYKPLSVEFGYTANAETYFTRLYVNGNTVYYTIITGWFSGDISQSFFIKYIRG